MGFKNYKVYFARTAVGEHGRPVTQHFRNLLPSMGTIGQSSIWKNCERLLNTSLQFIHLAFLVLLLKRF